MARFARRKWFGVESRQGLPPRQRSVRKRPGYRRRLELLEDRMLLSGPGDTVISASQTLNNGPSGSGEKFLGGSFNKSATVGSIKNGFGLQAGFNISGNVGLDVGYSASLGSVSASYSNIDLNQNYVAPTTFNQSVNLNTALSYAGGTFSTTGLSANVYANLDTNISGSVGGTLELFNQATTANYPFNGSLNNMPLFNIGLGPTLQNDLGVTLNVLGFDLTKQLNDEVSGKSYKDIDKELTDTPPFYSIAGDLSLSTAPVAITQGLSLEAGGKNSQLTGSLDLGSLSVYVPDIDLNSINPNQNGVLTNSKEGEVAELNIQMGALAASALAASLGQPELGALGGTTTVKFGTASIEVTPVSFEMGPVLYLEQIGTITPYNTLTYNFTDDSGAARGVNVTLNGRHLGAVNSVTFIPGVDKLSIQDPFTSDIVVTPTWNFGMSYSTELDLNLDLEGALTVGQLTASIKHVGDITLGPLYEQDFDFANFKLGQIWSNNDQPFYSAPPKTLPSFTIQALPLSLDVTKTADDGTIDSLSYAVFSANQIVQNEINSDPSAAPTPQYITIESGIHTWGPGALPMGVNTPATIIIQGAGTDHTVIDASNLDGTIIGVAPGANLTLEGMTIENASSSAIDNGGTLSVSDCTFANDTASTGGAIYSNGDGAVTIDNSVFTHDTALGGQGGVDGGGGGSGYGGAIYYSTTQGTAGSLDVENTTLSNDEAIGGDGGAGISPTSGTIAAGFGGLGGSGYGGGLYVVQAYQVTLLNDTFSDDEAQGGAGGSGGVGGPNLNGGGPGGAGGPGGNGQGGGLVLSGVSEANLANNTFNGDSAQGGAGGAGGAGGNGEDISSGVLTGPGGPGADAGVGGNGDGGAIFVNQSGSYTLINDTLSGNNALAGNGAPGGAAGAGLPPAGSHGAASNNGRGDGGGLNVSGGTINLINTLIALNNASTNGVDVFGNISFSQQNLIGHGVGSNLDFGDAGGDLVGYTASQLKLGALGDNGGPTQTMALLAGSPAIAAGDASPGAGQLPDKDQRGFARTINGHVDIGAVEYQYDLAVTGSVDSPFGGPDFGYFYTVTNNGPVSVTNVTLTVPLPDGIAFQQQASPGWTESDPGVGNSGTVTFTYALLTPGQSANVNITAELQNSATAVGAILTTTATVGPTTSDDNLQNNSSSLIVNHEQEGLAIQAPGGVAEFDGQTLFHFNDPNNSGAPADDFTATVNWGDSSSNSSNDPSGTVSVVADANGGFDVRGSHTFAEEGSYAIKLTVAGLDGTQFSTALQQLFAVADAPLTAGPLTPPLNASIGQPISNSKVVLFHFTDANPNAAPSDFAATATWGDGMTNTSYDGSGNVSVAANPAGGFDVYGLHTYNETLNPGTFEVQVSDAGGASTSASTTTFYVLNPDLPLVPGALHVPSVTTEGQSISNQLLFQFSDPDLNAKISGYQATVFWGDGSDDASTDGNGAVRLAAAGTLSNGNLLFDVYGSHTYVAGSDYFGVEITDLGDPGQDTGGQVIYANSAAPLNIIDPPVKVSAGPAFAATAGFTSNVTVATFTDPGITEPPDSVLNPYLATVEWGDGSSTMATGLAQADFGQPVSQSYIPVLNSPTVIPLEDSLADGTYYYTITSTVTSTDGTLNAEVESAPSNEVSAQAITSVIAGNTVESEIVLNWQPVTGASGYKIYRGTSPGGESALVATITDGTTDSFTDDGTEATYPDTLSALPANYVPRAVGANVSTSGGSLAAGAYYYTVTSTTATLESTPSSEVAAITTGSTSEVALSWGQVPGATGYNIYRGTSPGEENSLIATIADGSADSFTDTGTEMTSATPPQELVAGRALVSAASETTPTYIVLGTDGRTYSVNLAHQYALPGTYTITIFLDHEGVLTPAVTTTATILPANPTVGVTDSGGPYSGSTYMASATVDGVASVDGVSPTIQYYQLQGKAYVPISYVPVHAGSYEVTATFASPDTGNMTVSNPTTFTITPVAFDYQIGSTSQNYGTAANLASALGTTISTGVNNETLTITYISSGDSATANVQAGGYSITGSLSDGTGLASDYNGNLTPGTLTVIAVTPTVSVTDNGGSYNSSAYGATAASVTGVPSDGILASFGSKTLSYSYYAGTLTTAQQVAAATALAGAPIDAGSYTVVAHYTSNNINYTNADSAPVNFSIIKGNTITSLAARSNGQTVSLIAIVTAAAPGSGTPTGSVDFFDSTTSTDLGSAPLSGGIASLTTGLLPAGSQTIVATYSGFADFTTSNTSVTLSTAASVYVLNPSAAGALNISGNADLIVPGIVDVDSNSASAVIASGKVRINAGAIDVVGKVLSSGKPQLNSTPITGATPFADPLAQLPVPGSGLTKQTAVNLRSNSSLTIKPGIYSQINVSGNARLVMSPGIYVIAGGGFTISGNASVQGSGVLIYNAGSNFPKTRGNFGSVTVSGKGNVTLTPMTTGVYAGILIFQSRDNPKALSLSGNASTGVAGTIYAARAQVIVSGNAHLQDPIVAGGLQLTGNAMLNLGAPSSGPSNSPFVTSPNLNLAAIQQLFAAEADFLSQPERAQAELDFSRGTVDAFLLDELFETWLELR